MQNNATVPFKLFEPSLQRFLTRLAGIGAFLLSKAACAEGNAAPVPQPTHSWIMMLLLLVLMYFLVYRPQSKRAKAQKRMLEALQVGDEVLTSSGFVGTIARLATENEFLEILLTTDGPRVKLRKDCLISVLPKGTMQQS